MKCRRCGGLLHGTIVNHPARHYLAICRSCERAAVIPASLEPYFDELKAKDDVKRPAVRILQ